MVAIQNAMLTWDNLQKWEWTGPNIYILCNRGEKCTTLIWAMSICKGHLGSRSQSKRWGDTETRELRTNVGNINFEDKENIIIRISSCIWHICLERTNRILKDYKKSPSSLSMCIHHNSMLWAGTNHPDKRSPRSIHCEARRRLDL